MYRKVSGFFRMVLHLCSSKNRNTLKKIVFELTNKQDTYKQKVFVLMVGYSKSGKTTLRKNNKMLKKLFNLSTNDIHDQLNREFPFLKDDNTNDGEAYWERQFLTRIIRKRALKKVLSQGFGVVNDSANLNRQERKRWLKMAKGYGYKTWIVWVTCSEYILLKRLREADNKLAASGKKRTWVSLYNNVQKKRFNPPLSREADVVIRYKSQNHDSNTSF